MVIKKIKQFTINWFGSFLHAYVNLMIFFPYFFSVPTLLKTFFYPWKNISNQKHEAGFSLSRWLSEKSFNAISIVIAICMRGSLIIFYFLLQIGFLFVLPAVIVSALLLYPLFLVFNLVQADELKRKNELKEKFIRKHLLNEVNKDDVASWFEMIYQTQYRYKPWWLLSQLFAIPPLARDWATGYTPELDKFTIELTSPAYHERTANMLDRKKELELIERILVRSHEANVLIVGEDGVGKHTIVDALAKRIYEGNTAAQLMYKRVLKLDMEKILSQNTDQIKREECLDELFREAEHAKNCVLLVDGMDRYLNIFSSFTKFIDSPDIQFIGITTPFAYQKYIYTNEKIARSFEKVDVFEVSKEDALTILLSNALLFERRYNVAIPYESLLAVIEKSVFFITNIPFPEKAIQLLDDVCSYTNQKKQKNVVLPEIIDVVLSEKTHGETTITDTLRLKLLHLEQSLSQFILGQDEALALVSSVLRRSFLLLGKRKKPLSSFLFLGPTGVGKTETANALLKIFFGSTNHLIRLDMAEYQSTTDIQKLIGSSEAGEPGFLTEKIRQMPYGILLLDEIEKANKDLINIFLTILDEGYFVDGYGKRVDCKNLVVIATSNAASDIMFQNGYNAEHLIDILVEHQYFTPEFLNRFDGIIPFHRIDQKMMQIIARRMADQVSREIEQTHGVVVHVSDQFILDAVIAMDDPRFGVRSLERILRSKLEDNLAKQILAGKLKPGDTYVL